MLTYWFHDNLPVAAAVNSASSGSLANADIEKFVKKLECHRCTRDQDYGFVSRINCESTGKHFIKSDRVLYNLAASKVIILLGLFLLLEAPMRFLFGRGQLH
jgi:hypothetical protein